MTVSTSPTRAASRILLGTPPKQDRGDDNVGIEESAHLTRLLPLLLCYRSFDIRLGEAALAGHGLARGKDLAPPLAPSDVMAHGLTEQLATRPPLSGGLLVHLASQFGGSEIVNVLGVIMRFLL